MSTPSSHASVPVPLSARAHTVVIGGGVAGLTAAIRVRRAGGLVTLLESAPRLGGRAATEDQDGIRFNLGPHALYRAGAGLRILEELGIHPEGGIPGVAGGLALRGGRAFTLPVGLVSMLTTRALGLGEKLELGQRLAALPTIDPDALGAMSVAEWLAPVRHPGARLTLEALVRVATYANNPERLSASAAVAQLQRALGASVLYLHEGWQTLVDALAERARADGVEILTGARAVEVTGEGSVGGVRLSAGRELAAGAVILAVPPEHAAHLLRRFGAPPWRLVPARAACLDVALHHLPLPSTTFALGLDEPTYFSVHSAVARLSARGEAVLHVARYLAPDDAGGDVADLERVLDLVQPGWRPHVAQRRFFPNLTVSHGVPLAGVARPSPVVEGVPGAYLAGDWVGAEGMLADAAFASADAAAAACIAAAEHHVGRRQSA